MALNPSLFQMMMPKNIKFPKLALKFHIPSLLMKCINAFTTAVFTKQRVQGQLYNLLFLHLPA